MDFTKKIPSLVSLTPSIVFKDLSEVKTTFIRLINVMQEVGRVLTKKQWELRHACASYVILNQIVFLLV